MKRTAITDADRRSIRRRRDETGETHQLQREREALRQQRTPTVEKLILGKSKEGEDVWGGVDRQGKIFRRRIRPISKNKPSISHAEIKYNPNFSNKTQKEIDDLIRAHYSPSGAQLGTA
jgi:hypothetical protein